MWSPLGHRPFHEHASRRIAVILLVIADASVDDPHAAPVGLMVVNFTILFLLEVLIFQLYDA